MDNRSLTFEQLPSEVARQGLLIEELINIVKNISPIENKHEDEFLNVEEASKFLGYTAGTLRKKSSLGEIPSILKGKKLYFLKEDLISFLKSGRRKSIQEIQEEANHFDKKRR